MEWFEDAYFLFTVRLFDASLTRSKAAPKKIYCIDHALVTYVSSGILVNAGHLLENLVFISLRRHFPSLYYYKTKEGKEVDFIAVAQDCTKRLIQVCESLASEQTKKREVSSPLAAMQELSLASATIVTREEEGKVEYEGKIITILPIWHFLLEIMKGEDK